MPSASSQPTHIALAALSLLVMAYSLLIAQQILLGILIVTVIWMVYLLFQFIAVLSRLATALERLVQQRADDAADGRERRDGDS